MHDDVIPTRGEDHSGVGVGVIGEPVLVCQGHILRNATSNHRAHRVVLHIVQYQLAALGGDAARIVLQQHSPFLAAIIDHLQQCAHVVGGGLNERIWVGTDRPLKQPWLRQTGTETGPFRLQPIRVSYEGPGQAQFRHPGIHPPAPLDLAPIADHLQKLVGPVVTARALGGDISDHFQHYVLCLLVQLLPFKMEERLQHDA